MDTADAWIKSLLTTARNALDKATYEIIMDLTDYMKFGIHRVTFPRYWSGVITICNRLSKEIDKGVRDIVWFRNKCIEYTEALEALEDTCG